MNEQRSSKRILIVGAQGTGKSVLSKQFIQKTIDSPHNKKVLVLCPDDEEKAFNFLPKIESKNLRSCKHNRLVFEEENENFYLNIRDNFYHGLLVIDDGQFFVSNQRNEMFTKLIQRARQKNIDVIFSCHGLKKVPVSFWEFFTDLILFYTAGSLNSGRQNIPDFEDMVNNQQRVNETVESTRNFHYFEVFKLQPSVFDFLNTKK